jgi:transposase InsO family protein
VGDPAFFSLCRRNLLAAVAGDRRDNYRGADVVATLERATRDIGLPKTIRLDNGPEFVSKELDLWAFMRGVTLDFSRPGKPTDNSFIESFNGKFRAECLNANWFLSLDEAPQKCEAWRRDYNDVRPHSSIGNAERASSAARQPRPAGRQMKPEFPGQAGPTSGQVEPNNALTFSLDPCLGADQILHTGRVAPRWHRK